ncbi:hypothetical protein FGO68_gene6845 [Halteria grandinella]|uniref:Uncharacterized protein n=1 Tax=Halteria grandinella TaxID=5974 RepID=A0A8J8NBM0_HALGN|nr:hypothetical protein FGO68_gene6845 [Halteria grandinella]
MKSTMGQHYVREVMSRLRVCQGVRRCVSLAKEGEVILKLRLSGQKWQDSGISLFITGTLKEPEDGNEYGPSDDEADDDKSRSRNREKDIEKNKSRCSLNKVKNLKPDWALIGYQKNMQPLLKEKRGYLSKGLVSADIHNLHRPGESG